MCLKNLIDEKPESDIGYKVLFKLMSGDLSGILYGGPYKLGEEYKADDMMLDTNDKASTDQSGFHVYRDLRDARAYHKHIDTGLIFKVRGRNLLASGLNFIGSTLDDELGIVANYGMCDVYEFMTILEEVRCV